MQPGIQDSLVLPYIRLLLADTKRHVIPATKFKFSSQNIAVLTKTTKQTKENENKQKTKQKVRFFNSMSHKDSFGLKKKKSN